MKDGIVLFAHGSRDPQWARPFDELAATLSQKTTAVVRVAYLELMAPTLAEAVDALAADGITAVRVVPVFLGQGGHTKQDLPKLVSAARDRHPGIDISLDPPIGEQRSVIEAIAAAIVR